MVYNPEGFTYNSTIPHGPSMTFKRTIKKTTISNFRKIGCQKKTDVIRLGNDKSKRKEIRAGSMLWSIIPKRRGNKKSTNG